MASEYVEKYGKEFNAAIYTGISKTLPKQLPASVAAPPMSHTLAIDNTPSPEQTSQATDQQLSVQISALRSLSVHDRPSPVKAQPKNQDYFIEFRKAQLRQDIESSTRNSAQEVELHLLEQAEYQDDMRKKVLNEYKLRSKSMNSQSHLALERTLLDRSFYKRVDAVAMFRSKQESRMVAKYEQVMRNGQELKKRNRAREQVAEILNFQRDFFDFHKKKYNSLRKSAVASRGKYEMRDKAEQNLRDREEQERIKALRDNDLAKYYELVDATKNTRIFEIINKTDNYLRELGAKVKVQKGAAEDSEDEDFRMENSEDVINRIQQSTKVYYKITHTIVEDLETQPSILEGGTLKSYQMHGLNWLLSLYNNQLHGILADEMGLGKTIQTISLFAHLIEYKKEYGPYLVVVPLSTVSNWLLELTKWAPSISKVAYKGPPAVRKAIKHSLQSRDYNVVLTTYEYIMKDRAVLSKFHWTYIVVDEGHRMKNSKSKFTQTLGQSFMSQHRLLLTGTPLQNNLAELWSLLNFLVPKIFSSVDEFDKWFSQPLKQKQLHDETKLNEEETLVIINMMHQVLRPFLLRRIKKEVEKELPEKTEHVLKVELSHWQTILYKSINDHGTLGVDPITGRSRTLANSVMQLRKVCNHPYLFYPQYEDYPTFDEIWRCCGKFDLIDRIIPKFLAFNHRILIFSQMTQLLDIFQKYLDYRGYRYLRLDGGTKAESRDEATKLFNAVNSPYDIFLLSTRAGGLGLNLQTADTVIIYDSDWNPQMDKQAQDRAHRIGQTREVRVYRMVTNTFLEEAILSRAEEKKDLDEKVIQAGLFNRLSSEQEHQAKLKDLFNQENDEEEKEIYSDEQINELIARSEEEKQAFEEMDRERYEHEFQNNQTRLYTDQDEVPLWIQNDERNDEDYSLTRACRPTTFKDFSDDENGDFPMKHEQYTENDEDSESYKQAEMKHEESEEDQSYEYDDDDPSVGTTFKISFKNLGPD